MKCSRLTNFHKDHVVEVLENTKNVDNLRGKNVLHITHVGGGGTDTFVFNLIEDLKNCGVNSFILRPTEAKNGRLNCAKEKNLPDIDFKDEEKFISILEKLNVGAVHIHHLLGYSSRIIDILISIRHRIGVWIVFTVHDYFAYCPNIVLMHRENFLCLNYDERCCNRCQPKIPKFAKKSEANNPSDRRRSYEHLFKMIDKVTVPNRDLVPRMESAFPGITFDVIEHNFSKKTVEKVGVPSYKGNFKVLVVIGQISHHKGFRVIKALAEFIKSKELPLKIVVVGCTDDDESLVDLGVTITGRYNGDIEALRLIQYVDADYIFIPSIWPETYSYTLSIGLSTGLPCFSFDIGAQACRIKDLGMPSNVVPIDKSDDPEFIYDMLINSNCSKNNFNGHKTNPMEYYK